MIVLNNGNENTLNSIIADNPTAKIGRYLLPISHFNNQLGFHDGHKAVVNALRNDGCNLIVFEVIDINKFIHFNDDDYVIDDTEYDHTFSIDELDDNLNVDYLVFCNDIDDNVYPRYDGDNANLILSRLQNENIQEKYQFSSEEFKAVKGKCLWSTCRNIDKPITIAYYMGIGEYNYYGFKEYKEKYSDHKILLIPTIYNEGVPATSKITTNELFLNEINNDILEYSKYLQNLIDSEWLNEQQLKINAFNLGGQIQYKKVELDNFYIIRAIYRSKSNAQVTFERKVDK